MSQITLYTPHLVSMVFNAVSVLFMSAESRIMPLPKKTKRRYVACVITVVCNVSRD